MNIGQKANVLLGGVAAVALTATTLSTASPPGFVQNGKAGFVVSEIKYALSQDAAETGACPDGMTEGMRRQGGPGYGAAGAPGAGQRPAGASATPGASTTQGAATTPRTEGASSGGQRPAGASEEELARQYRQMMNDPNRPNPCMNPEKIGPDPKYRTVNIPDTKAYGIDMDGRDSRAKGKPMPGTCAHNDLVGMNGERGIDNQFYRLVGCNNAYQSTGQGNTYTIEMHTGAWGILISLTGVDDIRNDDNVEVGIFANADPIELSPNREPLLNATYAAVQDPRFRATTRGRIKDGVLTTDPVNVRFHKITNSIYLERPLNDARLSMTLSAEGTLEGYLAGYTPVEDLYNFEYAYRNGKDAKGGPASPRAIMGSSNGRAGVLGYTCNGVYHSLHDLADGNPDPATGKCTSISTQYRVKAIPAFVVDVKTESTNDALRR